MKNTAFWNVTPAVWQKFTEVSEKSAALTFKVF
jgi:hypothetical protein